MKVYIIKRSTSLYDNLYVLKTNSNGDVDNGSPLSGNKQKPERCVKGVMALLTDHSTRGVVC